MATRQVCPRCNWPGRAGVTASATDNLQCGRLCPQRLPLRSTSRSNWTFIVPGCCWKGHWEGMREIRNLAKNEIQILRRREREKAVSLLECRNTSLRDRLSHATDTLAPPTAIPQRPGENQHRMSLEATRIAGLAIMRLHLEPQRHDLGSRGELIVAPALAAIELTLGPSQFWPQKMRPWLCALELSADSEPCRVALRCGWHHLERICFSTSSPGRLCSSRPPACVMATRQVCPRCNWPGRAGVTASATGNLQCGRLCPQRLPLRSTSRSNWTFIVPGCCWKGRWEGMREIRNLAKNEIQILRRREREKAVSKESL